MLQRETEMLGVERHGASHIFHVVTEAVNTLDVRPSVNCEGAVCVMVTLHFSY